MPLDASSGETRSGRPKLFFNIAVNKAAHTSRSIVARGERRARGSPDGGENLADPLRRRRYREYRR